MRKESFTREDFVKLLSDGGELVVSNDGTYLCVMILDKNGDFYVICSMDVKSENMVTVL